MVVGRLGWGFDEAHLVAGMGGQAVEGGECGWREVEVGGEFVEEESDDVVGG